MREVLPELIPDDDDVEHIVIVHESRRVNHSLQRL
jgi:hypothetical protein